MAEIPQNRAAWRRGDEKVENKNRSPVPQMGQKSYTLSIAQIVGLAAAAHGHKLIG